MESTIDKTLRHIIFLARHLKKWDLRSAIIVILMELGVPTKCVGFELLMHCILLQNEDGTRALTNDIYLETTLRYKQNSEKQVEQAIRDVIKTAWHNILCYFLMGKHRIQSVFLKINRSDK